MIKKNGFTFKSSFRGYAVPEESHETRSKRFFAPFLFALNDGKKAFTLAEVLITLTIIGVIAALTIPNLMQSYKKHQVEVGIKEAYSIISNATKMAIAEHGNPDGWDFNSSPGYAPTYFVPYVKTSKICSTKITGCFENNGSNGIWYYLNGNKFSEGSGGGYGSSYYYTMILQNGMHVGIWAPEKRNQTSTSNVITFLVDINGGRGTSTIGKDIFVFQFNAARNTPILSYANRNLGVPYALPDPKTECTLSGNGQTCSFLIERNGWRIPDDYPVKKW